MSIKKRSLYSAQTGLPFFDHAAVITIGSWYYGSALPSMGGDPSFCCCEVNIGAIYKPLTRKSCALVSKRS